MNPPKFKEGDLVKYHHASIMQIGIWPQSNWPKAYGNKIFQVLKSKQVFIRYPVLDVLNEYTVIVWPVKASSYKYIFLEPQLTPFTPTPETNL